MNSIKSFMRKRDIGVLKLVLRMVGLFRIPPAAISEIFRDSFNRLAQDAGIERAIGEGMEWLKRAQDNSTSTDGGVARHYSLITGWSPSYPETTGYIIPTMLAYAKLRGDETARKRAKRMLDWLVSIQFPNGGFQGGTINATTIVPVTFNTGQILLGLAIGVREFGHYRETMCRAADWLVKIQDPDGCWRKHSTSFAKPGEKSYETHIAWGLLEAARIEPDKPYAEAAIANIQWALSCQRDNGWFEKCCLDDPSQPLTHTLGYALRGIIEAYRFTKDESFLKAARKTADGLLLGIQDGGFLPGRLGPNWHGTVRWACLTGSVQIAHCWLMLYQDTGEVRYRDAAYAVNKYVRCTMNVNGTPETRGAIKGSFPVQGKYNSYQYPNWACKFFVDSNMLEKKVREDENNYSEFITITDY
ncbi:MAG: hypothetical protein ACE5KZ_10215 [Candidatus Scalinduaceae bacterium]